MEKINVKLNSQNYPILIGVNLVEKINQLVSLTKYSKIALLTDNNVAKLYLDRLIKIIPNIIPIIVPSGEKNKNINTVQLIWEQLLKNKFDRQSLLVNLGGGVIGDLGGFAAATYMRGIDFIQIPTSLLAMVDASVGGKTGFNFAGCKNLIGLFNQPQAVICDVLLLSTLPKRELISGLAEVIKHGVIADKNYLDFVTSKRPVEFTKDELIQIIKKSCLIKKSIVEKDEKESGLRKILNFGHTLGHAIEALSLETKNPLLHGEAVALGMLIESKISNLTGLLNEKQFQQIKNAITRLFLAKIPKTISLEKLLSQIDRDKKNSAGKINWVLLKKLGQAQYDLKVDPLLVIKAIKEYYE